MIQYEDQGPGAQCPTGGSLEPVTTVSCVFHARMPSRIVCAMHHIQFTF